MTRGKRMDLWIMAAAVVLGIVVLIYPLRKRRSASDSPGKKKADDDESRAGGLALIRGSRQLQLISALLVVGVIVAQVVDLQFNWAVQSVTGSLDQRTVFYGNVFSVMGIAAFLFTRHRRHVLRRVMPPASARLNPESLTLMESSTRASG